MGKNLVFVPEWHSTNSLAMDLGQRETAGDGTVVITDNQHSGRGQRGSRWVSEPGKNLTFSVVLKPNLRPDQLFIIAQTIALGVADYVKTKTSGVKIKWPNDILVFDKKVCGILIESSLAGPVVQFVVAGIGLNVNQTEFDNPRATSLKTVTGNEFILNDELNGLLHALEVRYLQWREGFALTLRQDYHQFLYRAHEKREFKTNTHTFTGSIEQVDDQGRLAINTTQGIKLFEVKEIAFADWA